jgi:hypothetical protein
VGADHRQKERDADAVTIAILALLTLIEGVRRVPGGSVVLRRVLFGPWTVERPEPRERLRLLSWWSPLMTTIVLAPRQSYEKITVTALRERLDERALHTALFDLRFLGSLELFVLVLGVPLALRRFGAIGFLAAMGAILLLCLAIVTALAFSARGAALGKPWRAAWRWALPFVSPFAAPRAGEVLLEEAIRAAPPAVVSSVLLPADAFLGWMRPFVYDATNGAEVDRRFLDGVNLKELRASLAQRPPAAHASQNAQGLWCPRCGATFIHGEACSECGIPLIV